MTNINNKTTTTTTTTTKKEKKEKKGGGEEGGEGKLLRMGRDGQDDIEGSIEVLADLKSCLMGV